MAGRRTTYLDAPTPLAFAHRGGALTSNNSGIENSLAAFVHACDLGYRYLETDVRVTVDRVVYVCHDPNLSRLTGQDVEIGEVTAAELDAYLIDGREPFLRLETLYEELPTARFNIDVKSDDAVQDTCDVVRRVNGVDRTLLAAFEHRRILAIRRTLPEVATSASSRETVLVKLVPRWILGRWWRSSAVCLQVPHRHHGLTVVTRNFVAKAHQLGLQVHVWTIDDPQEMHVLLDRGVDGIMTDRTDILKAVLIDRGEWSQP